MNKKVFEDDLISGMQDELRKQASDEQPANLVKAAECLHAALEIFESSGLQTQADQVLNLLQKIAESSKSVSKSNEPDIQELMRSGITQRDILEFTKGNLLAKNKFNNVLQSLGFSDQEINRFLEKVAKKPKADPHTKGLTPAKEIANYKSHGTPFNMADDNAADVAYAKWLQNSKNPKTLTKDDVNPELADLLDADSFDINASDDELLNLEVKDDSLEVFDKEIPLTDFEDERD
jgi:hypothetical protein